MKPQRIDGTKLTRAQRRWVWIHLLQPNGVRHHVPEDAIILIRGHVMDVETFDIEKSDKTHRTVKYPRTRKHWHPWRLHWPGNQLEVPVKVRTYRIRHDPGPIPKDPK